jgi:hypothetical protein
LEFLMSKIDIIIERLKSAPPEVVEEVFALIERIEAAAKVKVAPVDRGIMKHFGILKDSKAFEGDPVAIQRAMRDEWN